VASPTTNKRLERLRPSCPPPPAISALPAACYLSPVRLPLACQQLFWRTARPCINYFALKPVPQLSVRSRSKFWRPGDTLQKHEMCPWKTSNLAKFWDRQSQTHIQSHDHKTRVPSKKTVVVSQIVTALWSGKETSMILGTREWILLEIVCSMLL
jgi:hypothetical protein